MEADLDKQEPLRPAAGELSGDRLLQTNYVSTGSASARRRKVWSVCLKTWTFSERYTVHELLYIVLYVYIVVFFLLSPSRAHRRTCCDDR